MQGLAGPLSTHHSCTDLTPISTAVLNLCFSWSSVSVDPSDQSAKPIFNLAIVILPSISLFLFPEIYAFFFYHFSIILYPLFNG
jgi:hypothetical protein